MTDLTHNHEEFLPFYFDHCPACDAEQVAYEAEQVAARAAAIEAAGGYWGHDDLGDEAFWVPLTKAPTPAAGPRNIRVFYSALDGAHKTRIFKTLAGAQRFAQEWVGPNAEVAFSGYAVSADGIGKVEVEGATLAELFASAAPAPAPRRHDEFLAAENAAILGYERHLENRMEPEYSPAEMRIMRFYGTV